MSKNNYVKVITDLSCFQERVDEITATTSFDEVKSAISTIKKYLNSNSNAVCLCAPQVGINLRLFVVKKAKSNVLEDRYKVFLNPMIVVKEGLHLSRENNLSIPNKEYIIPRSNKIHLAYQEYDGHIGTETFIGTYAEVIQQMVEMLDGITLEDYGLEIDEDFDNAKKKDKEAIVQMYLESLKKNFSSLREEINNTPELKQINDTIDFNTELLLGNIQPLDDNGNPVKFGESNGN